MRRLGWMVVGGAGLALVAVAGVHLFAASSTANGVLSTVPLVAHGLAFPLPSGALLTLLGAGMLTLALPNRRALRRRRTPRALVGGIFVIAGLLLALSATNIALPHSPRGDVQEGSASFVMVSWNALDHFDESSARQIFSTLKADVAVLPEVAGGTDAEEGTTRIAAALVEAGLDPQAYDIFVSPPTGTHIAPLTVIVRKEFARYESLDVKQMTFGTVHLMPPPGSGLPEILGIHTAPPVPKWMPAWKSDLKEVRDLAGDGAASAVIAGDLNATLRHGQMGEVTTHVDVLTTVPTTRRGTWPASAPPILRSSIDHVLVPKVSYVIQDARVIEIPGSDHAAIATTLSIIR